MDEREWITSAIIALLEELDLRGLRLVRRFIEGLVR